MLYLFSADKKFTTWRRLWVALARAEMELGLPVTQEQVDELEAHNQPIVISQDELEKVINGFIDSLATRSGTGLRVSDATIRKIRAMAVENGYLRPTGGGEA